jgi:hypothetical protein
LSVFFV